MRILVTGVSGQVGGALLERLRGHDVIRGDRATLDLAQVERIGEVLDRLSPDLIINPAAYTAVDKAEDERDLATLVNAKAPEALARWTATKQVPLVHFSTDYVFDGTGTRPWREDDTTGPLSVYGASKLAGENAIRAAGGSYLIVRTSWVYATKGQNFLRTIARLARERKELRIVADQIGAPTSAGLIAEAVTRMIGGDIEIFRERCALANGIVNLAASGEASWYDFAVAIVNGLKLRGVTLMVEKVLPITSEEYPTHAKRPGNSRLDLSRLQVHFGMTPSSWRDALAAELNRVAEEMR